jgi:murein DD-endopeptidase MepM/ murein hydrolase activator NlpD
MHRSINTLLAVLFLCFTSASPVFAQQPDQPVYIVQPGDSLTSIAFRFGISADELIQVNGLTDPNQLKAGDSLVIPGLTGIQGTLTTESIVPGETLALLSRTAQVSSDMLIRLNHLTSPGELYAGGSVIIPKAQDAPVYDGRAALTPGDTLLETAIRQGTDLWTLAAINQLAGAWDALPGDTLVYPVKATDSGAQAGLPISDEIASISVSPLPLVQGHTTEIKITTHAPVQLSGKLITQDLNFHQIAENTYVALSGVYDLTDPGIYPYSIAWENSSNKTTSGFEQGIAVAADAYNNSNPPNLEVDPTTIDPKVTVPENKVLADLTAPVTPDRLWSGTFASPAYNPKFITDYFGDRRTYNGDPTVYFHTGTDYGGGGDPNFPTPIKAAADGVVMFTGLQIVRGNMTVIDHGWGVYTCYFHQSKFLVKAGDTVKTGQVIGYYGATGRVTGPHLHWEVWVNGIQVDPTDWLEQVYP